jgi:protein TonB
MKTLMNTVTELDELVFENRNKNYGAYALRQSYSKDLTKGLLIGTAVIFAFFGTMYGIHYANFNIETPQEAIITMHPVDMTPEKKIEEKKIIEAVKPPKAPVTPPTKAPEQPVVTTPATAVTTVPVVADSSQNLGKPNELAGNGNPGSIGTNPNGNNGHPGDTTTTVISAEPVTFADTMPENPGLNRFLVANIKYPRVAKEEGIEGVVYVAFVVGTDGNVSRVSIEKGVHPLLDNEAKRVAAIIPKWKPAKMNGRSVPFLYRLPIRFRLN